MFHLDKLKKPYRKYKTKDHNMFKLPRFASKYNSIKNLFKRTLHASKRFGLVYGGLSKRYIKPRVKSIIKKGRGLRIELIRSFERRLDSTVYRAHFTTSIQHAQQLISHKHRFTFRQK